MPMPDEAEVEFGGITFNGLPDSNGVKWTVGVLDGWGSPAPTGGVQQRSGQHGGTDPRQYLGPRTLMVSGLIKAPSRGLRQDADHKLKAACKLDLFDFTVTETIPLFVRARRQGTVQLRDETDRDTSWQVELICPDPRIYSTTLEELVLQPPAASGGLRVPIRVPIRITGTSVSGDGLATNGGTVASWPVVRIDGPITDPSVTNVTTSQTVTWNGTLALGEYVVIDMGGQSALLMGQVDYTGRLSPDAFWAVQPGDNLIAFRGSAVGVGAQAEVQFRSAYL